MTSRSAGLGSIQHEFGRKGEEPGGDMLVEGLRWLLQELNGQRKRNGYRSRPWDTRLGTLELAIPKLRQG